MLTLFIYSITFSGASNTRFNAPTMCHAKPLTIQGGALRTWSYRSSNIEQAQVTLATNGRPLDTEVELWHGPNNAPCKMRVFVEDGRPFNVILETPRSPNTIAIRNIGSLEFPIIADVNTNDIIQPMLECISASDTIQGGAIRTYPFNSEVEDVQILLRSDGRPLNSRIELLQGPNNDKQVIELYTQDGLDRPFFCVLNTQGNGSVVRIINTSPIEFPLTAEVGQYV